MKHLSVLLCLAFLSGCADGTYRVRKVLDRKANVGEVIELETCAAGDRIVAIVDPYEKQLVTFRVFLENRDGSGVSWMPNSVKRRVQFSIPMFDPMAVEPAHKSINNAKRAILLLKVWKGGHIRVWFISQDCNGGNGPRIKM